MAKKKRIAFLLGAGASQACGMPGTVELTEVTLSKIKNHYRNVSPETQNKSLGDPARFLEIILKELVEHHDSCAKPVPNYEHVYDLANELSKVWHKDHASTLAVALTRRFSQEYPYEFTQFVDNYDLGQDMASTNIKWAIELYVSEILFEKEREANLKALDWLVHACEDSEMDVRDVITLNHDNILENLFLKNEIPIITGFEIKNEHGLRWDNRMLDNSFPPLRILKLHGSIDWHRPKRDKSKFFPDVYQYIYKDREDFAIFLQRRLEPFFLTGAMNKTSEYTQGIFWELLIRFEESLRRSDLLIVCGYSFGDQGINHIIFNWLDQTLGNRVLTLTDEVGHIRSNIEDHDNPKAGGNDVPKVYARKIKNLKIEELDLRTASWERMKALIEEW